MQKHVLTGIVGLIIGMSVGFWGANRINRDALQTATGAPGAVVASGDDSQNGSQSGMIPDVASSLEKANSEPGNFAAQMDTGQMYARIGRFDRAIEYFNRGLTINPKNFQAHVVLANAYFDARQYEEAEKAYTKALEINPTDLNARTDLGTTFVERQTPDYDRAISEFAETLSVDPKHEPTLYYLGVAYARKGEKQNAETTLERLKTANPSSDLIERLRQNIQSK